MKIVICLIVGFVLLFDYCVFKVSSKASEIEKDS